jgi:hypothetical protein
MGYIDVLIPLAAGILFIASPERLITKKDQTYDRKKLLLKRCGYVLIGVAALYLVIKLLE